MIVSLQDFKSLVQDAKADRVEVFETLEIEKKNVPESYYCMARLYPGTCLY